MIPVDVGFGKVMVGVTLSIYRAVLEAVPDSPRQLRQPLRQRNLSPPAWRGRGSPLSQHSETINNLNVFPVPDGDTGTDMLLTMRAAVRCVEESELSDVGGLAEVLARGALMGARGNSGVIVSQFLTGLARGLVGYRRDRRRHPGRRARSGRRGGAVSH